jgi:hypothetical protein
MVQQDRFGHQPKQNGGNTFTKKRALKGLKDTCPWKSKYLGLMLDSGLTWGVQLDNVTNRAYRAFWTRKGTFGKTWGLKPRVVHVLYTVVVRPIITCAATVWWPRMKYQTGQLKLSKLQRLACLGITGAMRAAPTTAIEVLPGPPLHLKMEAETQAGIYRLS